MAESFKKDFYIFYNGYFKNGEMLNDAGKVFISLLIEILNGNDTYKSEFYQYVTGIYVTSQDRTKRNENHSNGRAIDILVYPYGMAVWLFNKLNEYKFTVYISSYNYHLHFDLRENGYSGVECLSKPGKVGYITPGFNKVMAADGYDIQIADSVMWANYLMRYYYVYKLPALMVTKIYAGLQAPFLGAKKLFKYTIPEIVIPVVKTGLNWLLIGAGLVAVYLLKGNEKQEIFLKVKK